MNAGRARPSQRGPRQNLPALMRPLPAATLAALLAIAWALAGSIQNETPTGNIQGHVTFNDAPRPQQEYDRQGREIQRKHKPGEKVTPLANVEIVLEPKSSDVEIHDDAEVDTRRTRYAVSGQVGNFSFAHVPAGTYVVSATARAHNTRGIEITVDEGGVTPLEISLDRSEEELKLRQHQRVFGTRDKQTPSFSVSGYADDRKLRREDTLKMRLYRTRLSHILKNADAARALESVGGSYDAPDKLPGILLKPSDAPAPQPVLTREVHVAADKEGFFYQKLGMDRLPTGLYLAEIAHAGHNVCAWLAVTDTALIVKQAKGQTLAYAADMETGMPLANSEIRAYRNGRILHRRLTDSHGLASFTVSSPPAGNSSDANAEDTGEAQGKDSTRLTLVAVRGEDEAVIAQNTYANEEGDTFAIHAYTDRPIYRPGQRISWKAILRRERPGAREQGGDALNAPQRYDVPTGTPVTVVLKDPSGDQILSTHALTNRYGSVSGEAEINSEGATGVYSLLLTPKGGTPHSHDIVVASYRKPEFSVTVTPDKKRYTQEETVTMNVTGTFYFGAPVVGAKVKYEVYSSPDWAAGYSEDYGYDPETDDKPMRFRDGEGYYGQTVTRGTTFLDENGKAVIRFSTDQKPKNKQKRSDDGTNSDEEDYAPQEQIYTADVTVIESANRTVEENGAARVAAGDFRVTVSPDGYVALPGAPTNVVVTARDQDGNPVPHIPVTLESRFQERKKGSPETHYRTLSTQTVTTGGDGRGVVQVTPTQTGEIELRARAGDSHGHAIRGFSTLWAASEQGGDMDTEYADLSLLTDKRRYKPGDTARVLINASRAGESVLLTVEGERIYSSQLVPTQKHSTVVRVPILAEYGPNVSLAACYVREKHYAHSEIPLRVATPQQELKVTVTADREHGTGNREEGEIASTAALARYGPGDRVTYHVTTADAQGRPVPGEFSLGVVDEALYALREDNPQAMREAFYPRQINRVQTQYSFAVEYLGDADKAEPQIVARKKFPDTAFWQPDLQTDANGQATVAVVLPDNLTTWRATVTAHTLATRIGYAVDKVISTKDFLVRVETPRFLTQHDVSQIVAIVHNDTGTDQSVRVSLRADNLTVQGAASQPLNIAAGKSGQVVWPVLADNYGPSHLVVKAWTGRNAAGRIYTDGVESDLPVRAHGRETVQAFAGEVHADRPETEVLRLDSNTIPALSRLTVRITPSLAGSMVGATEYLVGYPYGCTEQTMSRFVPDLLVQRALGRNLLAGFKGAQDLPRMVRTGLMRLYRFQHKPSGAWGWWEHDLDDPWMTAYVLTGLATAQAQGYSVSASVLSEGRKAALKMADSGGTTPATKAFLLYALAMTENGDRDMLLSLREKQSPGLLKAQGLAYLVMTDKLLGKDTSAVLGRLLQKAVVADAMTHWTSGSGDFQWNDQETTALALRALVAVDRSDPHISQILRWIMLQRRGDYWNSTRDTAFVLAALCDYIGSGSDFGPGGSVNVRVNGRLIQSYTLTPDLQAQQEIVLHVPMSALRPDKNDVTLERSGGNSPVFYSVELKEMVASEDMPSQSLSSLNIQREYLRVKPGQSGHGSWMLTTEPTHNQLAVGDRVRVRLTIKAARDLAYVLIEDPFPSGCEPNERGDAGEITDWSFWWSSVDVRDDRIAFFAANLSKGTHIIEYNLRTQTPGSDHVMPTLIQAMYAPETRAETEEARLEIKP